MLRVCLRICLIACCALFPACGAIDTEALFRLDPGQDTVGPSPLVTGDPEGPIAEPELPPELVAQADASASPSLTAALPAHDDDGLGQPLFSPDSEKTTTRPPLTYRLDVESPDAPELIPVFINTCLLEQLHDHPVNTVTALDQRLRKDLETGMDVLHSYGYYAGKVSGKIRRDRKDEPDRRRGRERREGADRERGQRRRSSDPAERDSGAYVVTVTFEAGEQYTIGSTKVSVTKPLEEPAEQYREAQPSQEARPAQETQAPRRRPPQTLADVGLPDGAPAIADDVLNAVSEARERFRDRGYPYAAIASARYVLDNETRTLDASVAMDAGPLVYMGDIVVQGDSPVRLKYLESMRNWRPGRLWSQRRIENFRNALRQSGLFSAAEIEAAPTEDENGWRPVVLTLAEAPPRTVGGSVKYDSDFGPGVQAYWEHRNLTNRGDRLRLEAPVWSDLQEFVASYRLPFFKRRDQDLIAKAGLRNERTDAYEVTSAFGSVGLERRFSRHWRGSLSVMGEGGRLKDPDEVKTDYYMVGLPATLSYDGADNLLDATKGVRATLGAAPYIGEYHKEFGVLRSRLEAQAFVPVVKDAMTLAFRGMYGLLAGADADQVPASIRYYVGGGGSVRGYEYQSLGPRNRSNDPLGGTSALEFSGEARFRFTEMWGAVAFVDGGMAYKELSPDVNEEIRWGAGVGLRLYTAIGPIRLDVATPLNPRKDDSSLQIYFSIGQAF